MSHISSDDGTGGVDRMAAVPVSETEVVEALLSSGEHALVGLFVRKTLEMHRGMTGVKKEK